MITWTNEKRKLRDLIPWEHNPREINKAEAERLGDSLAEFGQIQTIAIGPNDEILDGHQRKAVWSLLPQFGPDYEVDVRVASRALTENERQKLVVYLHRGTLGDWDWDELANSFEVPDLLEWGFEESDLQLDWGKGIESPKEGQPNSRTLPIDVIYTLQGADATCCLAIRAGLKYGIQSNGFTLCPYCERGDEAHRVVFVDNDYFHYDHAQHLSVVRDLKPKYATVRDYMSEAQCAAAGIEFFSLSQVLGWAEDLKQYAQQVIVIPKVNVIDQIPEEYVLGYSIPTSHGGTPLPVEAFSGKRVHLLGGSWRAQLAHMAALGDDVISLDNNYIQNIAKQFGQFVVPSGKTIQLQDDGKGYLTNVRYVALALSFGAMGAKINELFKKET